MATLKDIADDCGISVQTAFQVLKGKGRISAATRERVQASAARLNYRPNAAARMLRTGATYNVVLAYVKQPGNPAFGAYPAEVLAEQLGEIGYRIEVKKAPTNEALIETLSGLVRSAGADAYVLWGEEKFVEEQGQLLQSHGAPFVARGYYPAHPDWYQADFDHRGIMAQNLAKLFELGHERIALLNHSHEIAAYAVNFRAAYSEILGERLGRPVPREWFFSFEETLESGAALVVKMRDTFLKPESERPTAIAVGEAGSLMNGVETALLAAGIRIGDEPGQVSIAGAGAAGDKRPLSGPSWTYRPSIDRSLVGRMIENQLVPLLGRPEAAQRQVRYCEPLTRSAPTLNIWDTVTIVLRKDLGAGGR